MESRRSKPTKHRRASSPVQSSTGGSEARGGIDADQQKRFIETARELGCDEDEAAFDEKLKRIAQAKPRPKDRKNPSKGRPEIIESTFDRVIYEFATILDTIYCGGDRYRTHQGAVFDGGPFSR